ncbi:MAG: S24/S26 family peptidase [Arenicellales bacterium]
MEPVLTDGETVDVLRRRRYFPGDVVTYFSPFEGRYLVHRFLGYAPSRGVWKCLVMADRGAKPDVLVECSRVLGKVTGRPGSGAEAARLGVRRGSAICRYVYWIMRIALRREREPAGRASAS